jgi:flagellar hook-basal body complex protein FliE
MMYTGIESIAAIAASTDPATFMAGATQTPNHAAPQVFADLIQRELGELNASVGAAETAMRDLAAGKPVELHEVMISLERARMSVQTFVQVRNKLVESYQDLMRMQL